MPLRPALPSMLALLSLSIFTQVARAEVSVSMAARPTSVRVGGRVVVKIEVSTDGGAGPEIRIPNFDGFEVLQQSVSRPMQFNFGLGGQSVRSANNYTFVLRALQPGSFTLQPTVVTVGGRRIRSAEVTIEVTGPDGSNSPAAAAQGSPAPNEAAAAANRPYVDGAQVDPRAFLRTIVDKPRPFVHEQVTVTIYLYSRDRLRSAPSIDTEPTTDGLWTRELQSSSKIEQVSRQRVNGTNYNVYVLRRFAAFPLRPGPVTIGALGLTIPGNSNVFDMFAGRGPSPGLTRVGVPVELDVQALPEGGPAAEAVVGSYRIVTKLDRAQVATGDAVTLTATVTGRGQLTTVRLRKPSVDGLDVFEPQVKDLIDSPRDLVGGTRIYEWLIVPQRPGTFTIPPFVLHTFDATRRRYTEARSEALTITAAGQPVAAAIRVDEPPDRTTTTVESNGETEALKLAPIRNHSALSHRVPAVSASVFYPYAVGSAPGAWLLMLLVAWSRRRLRAARSDPASRAGRAVKAHLEGARSAASGGQASAVYAGIAAAIQAALERALGEAIGSHTHDQLSELLARRGMDSALRGRIVETLQRCDYARFSASDSSAQSLAQEVEAAQTLVATIARAEVGP